MELAMKTEVFVPQIVEIMALPPGERHECTSALHDRIFAEYAAAIRAITPERAMSQVQDGSEVRTVSQVVGHIAEWERFIVMGASDILAGLEHPRMVTSVQGYREPYGREVPFDSIDDFNAYQADKHASWPWERMQRYALEQADLVHALFTGPRLLTAERLERTRPFRKRLPDGTRIDGIAMGWSLWITALEHEGVEHAHELGMEP
jgi:hypothetical protein